MSTQEELEEFLELFATKPYDRARENLITLIDSAKREGAIEELKKLLDFPVAVTPNAHFGYDDMVFLDDIKDRIAQLEQSEESK